MKNPLRHGGDHLANVLSKWNISAIFTLCGGHISPILVGCEERRIKVVDCRDERNAVFAADAWARMTGLPGVAAVTAGPGVTNTITALKNAQLAQTPLVLLGGATATVLKGRGALQDIDQTSLIRSAVKLELKCSTVAQLAPTLERALRECRAGVPGPVFVEVPVDVLYPEALVREWFVKEAGVEHPKTLGQRALKLYLEGHLLRQFHAPHVDVTQFVPEPPVLQNTAALLDEAAALLETAERPALVIGSQAMVNVRDATSLSRAVEALGLPVWLGGSARGLLGRHNPLQFRHARGKALKEADVVVVCGFPFDFRMKYGFGIGARAKVIAANLSADELSRNRTPDVAVRLHPGEFLQRLAAKVRPAPAWQGFIDACRAREVARDDEIRAKAKATGEKVDPIHFFLRLEEHLSDDAVLVVDGGDFVATAAYVLKPRAPLSWLDPGVFGTLGVGGGFAVGAATARRDAQVWVIYGDGSSAYSLAEFDTFARHGYAPIAVIGTDASWQQIARDQVTILGSAVGTGLRFTSYEQVAEGYGGKGLLLTDPAKVDETLAEAKRLAASGVPVCINVHIARTDFREGSISI
ncbi:MAG: thiamine pyrophosphate-binding protein [Myxococcaceae bacterium]|nr:thiamine pyrophosphate-binding protein [Myxococcaceae bacterium]MCA3012828.1 thiamine pyrophosphate-binding protein [Myxococcaceae bacterium]